MERAIAEIGEVGYSGVEMFDGNLIDYASRPRDLRAALRPGRRQLSRLLRPNFIFREVLDQELARIARVAGFAESEMGALHLIIDSSEKRHFRGPASRRPRPSRRGPG